MTVRVGFVGVGARSVREMLDLALMPNVEIVALCDVDLQRCEAAVRQVQERVGTERAPVRAGRFAEVADMLSAADPDAVYVSLPPFAHGGIEHALLAAGKAICVEKPVALTSEIAREIASGIRRRGVVSSVAYQLRYGPALQKARQILDGRVIGLVAALRLGGLPDSPWWRVQAQSGGMLVEQHTHGVDLMRYIAGEVESVYAQADTRLLDYVPGLDIHDVSCATVRFASGAVGTIVNSCAAAHASQAPFGNGVHFVADGVTVSVSGKEVVAVWEDGRREVFGEDEAAANFQMNQAFISAVETGDRSGVLSDYDEGVRTLEVTLAALESARRGEVVRVDVWR